MSFLGNFLGTARILRLEPLVLPLIEWSDLYFVSSVLYLFGQAMYKTDDNLNTLWEFGRPTFCSWEVAYFYRVTIYRYYLLELITLRCRYLFSAELNLFCKISIEFNI